MFLENGAGFDQEKRLPFSEDKRELLMSEEERSALFPVGLRAEDDGQFALSEILAICLEISSPTGTAQTKVFRPCLSRVSLSARARERVSLKRNDTKRSVIRGVCLTSQPVAQKPTSVSISLPGQQDFQEQDGCSASSEPSTCGGRRSGYFPFFERASFGQGPPMTKASLSSHPIQGIHTSYLLKSARCEE